MKIIQYEEEFKQQVTELVLHIQNEEAKINLTLEEQPDLLDIPKYYCLNGGRFWIAVDNKTVVGTIGFMNYEDGNAVLKKFFVRSDWRGKKLGLSLYKTLTKHLKNNGYKCIVLDTPSVAEESHKFYEKAGFKKIDKTELPFYYQYPDRNSYLYMLNL